MRHILIDPSINELSTWKPDMFASVDTCKTHLKGSGSCMEKAYSKKSPIWT